MPKYTKPTNIGLGFVDVIMFFAFCFIAARLIFIFSLLQIRGVLGINNKSVPHMADKINENFGRFITHFIEG